MVEMFSNNFHIFNSKEISKELGEQMFIEYGDTWVIEDTGFIAYSKEKVKYLYVKPHSRNNGIGSYLLSFIPDSKCTAIATKLSLNIFLKKGFKITKSFTNYFKLKYEPNN